VADAGLETCTTAALESGATKSLLALQNRNLRISSKAVPLLQNRPKSSYSAAFEVLPQIVK
jgi:hypothetical protein